MQKALVCTAFVFLGATAQAQWLNYRAAGTPATPDGKVNVSAPAPRAPDGKPDLTGVWHLQTTRQETSLAPTLTQAQGGGSYTGNIFRDTCFTVKLHVESGAARFAATAVVTRKCLALSCRSSEL